MAMKVASVRTAILSFFSQNAGLLKNRIKGTPPRGPHKPRTKLSCWPGSGSPAAKIQLPSLSCGYGIYRLMPQVSKLQLPWRELPLPKCSIRATSSTVPRGSAAAEDEDRSDVGKLLQRFLLCAQMHINYQNIPADMQPCDINIVLTS